MPCHIVSNGLGQRRGPAAPQPSSDAIARVTSMDSTRQPTLTRRSLFSVGGAVVIGIVGLSGCSGQEAMLAVPQQASDPHADARERAQAAARDLRDRLTAFARTDPGLAELATLLADRHRQQLEVLKAEPGEDTAGSEPDGDTVAVLVSAEREAAAEALNDLATTGAGTAALLAQLAASDAVYADLLASAAGQDGPGAMEAPAGTPDSGTMSATVDENTLSAWSRMLVGEYAAVYAFGVVRARVSAGRRSQAENDWAAHRRRRDDLAALLAAAGAPVPAALPAYDLGPFGDTEAQTIGLAARVETSVANLTAECFPLLRSAERPVTATILVASTRRAAGWSQTVVPLPDFPVGNTTAA
jgi:hypothetical protein